MANDLRQAHETGEPGTFLSLRRFRLTRVLVCLASPCLSLELSISKKGFPKTLKLNIVSSSSLQYRHKDPYSILPIIRHVRIVTGHLPLPRLVSILSTPSTNPGQAEWILSNFIRKRTLVAGRHQTSVELSSALFSVYESSTENEGAYEAFQNARLLAGLEEGSTREGIREVVELKGLKDQGGLEELVWKSKDETERAIILREGLREWVRLERYRRGGIWWGSGEGTGERAKVGEVLDEFDRFVSGSVQLCSANAFRRERSVALSRLLIFPSCFCSSRSTALHLQTRLRSSSTRLPARPRAVRAPNLPPSSHCYSHLRPSPRRTRWSSPRPLSNLDIIQRSSSISTQRRRGRCQRRRDSFISQRRAWSPSSLREARRGDEFVRDGRGSR